MTGLNKPGTVFVTGGMSGLGKALAQAYLQRGSDIAIFDLLVNEDVLRELEAARVDATQRVLAYAASVTDFDALQDALLTGYTEHRHLDASDLRLFMALRAATYVGWIVPRMSEDGAKARNQAFIGTLQALASDFVRT